MIRHFIIDTETTGLIDNASIKDVDLPEVIEFYGVFVDDEGASLSEIDHLVKPRKPISKESIKITGINDAMVRLSPSFDIIADEVIGAIEGADSIVAHNLQYDVEVLNIEAARCGRKINWPRRKICTIEQTLHLKGYRMSLSDLHEFLFGARFPGAHRARHDVEALARCFVELKKRGEL